MQEVEIKILRLTTGEDIIGSCVYDTSNNCVEIFNPMTVLIKRLPNSKQTMLFVSPWLPVEILEEDNASIDVSDIITILNPNENFKDYYSNAVVEYENALIDQQEILDEEDSKEEEGEEEVVKPHKSYKLH